MLGVKSSQIYGNRLEIPSHLSGNSHSPCDRPAPRGTFQELEAGSLPWGSCLQYLGDPAKALEAAARLRAGDRRRGSMHSRGPAEDEALARVLGTALIGVDGIPVEVEVRVSAQLPRIDIVGLPELSVRESAARVRAAISSVGERFPDNRVTVNLAPAALRKSNAKQLSILRKQPRDGSQCPAAMVAYLLTPPYQNLMDQNEITKFDGSKFVI